MRVVIGLILLGMVIAMSGCADSNGCTQYEYISSYQKTDKPCTDTENNTSECYNGYRPVYTCAPETAEFQRS